MRAGACSRGVRVNDAIVIDDGPGAFTVSGDGDYVPGYAHCLGREHAGERLSALEEDVIPGGKDRFAMPVKIRLDRNLKICSVG
jgi:hypothetical protein